MNKTKFVKKSILFATIGILAFSLIPVANAGVPGHMKERPKYNNLLAPFFPWNDPDFEFSASEDLYFRIGWRSTEEEIENDWAPKNPWKFKLFINNEEINLQRYDVKVDKTAGDIKHSVWYHVFGPGYFTEDGDYLLRFEFWVRRPYQGDDLNYWRIFVDYGGFVWGEPGTVASYGYSLNIVA